MYCARLGEGIVCWEGRKCEGKRRKVRISEEKVRGSNEGKIG